MFDDVGHDYVFHVFAWVGMHIGVILSLEGSGICFLELVDKQFCNFDLLLIYALEGSFRPSCIILRRTLPCPSISLSVYQYYSRLIVRRPEIETGIAF